MDCVFHSDAAGWSLALRLTAGAALFACVGLVCAQVPASSEASCGQTFGLPQTQFPVPAADSFQSYKGFQGRGSVSMGAGWRAGGLGGSGGGGLAGIQGRAGFGIQRGGSLGAGAPPNFNQMMRANVSLPINSSIGNFKLSFRDRMGPGGSGAGSNFGQGAAGTMFSTTSLGNGMFFSAGTNFGKGSMVGTPPGGFGRNSGGAGAKSPGPAVTLKLSF